MRTSKTPEDLLRTLNPKKILMEKVSAISLQSAIVTTYPGTKSYDEALKMDDSEWIRTIIDIRLG